MRPYIAANGTAEAQWYFAALAASPNLSVVATVAAVALPPQLLGSFAGWMTSKFTAMSNEPKEAVGRSL